MDSVVNHFPVQKCSGLQDFACAILKIFQGDTPDAHRNAPGAWTQTSIYAWLTGVPVVPVLRKNHWFQWSINRSSCCLWPGTVRHINTSHQFTVSSGYRQNWDETWRCFGDRCRISASFRHEQCLKQPWWTSLGCPQYFGSVIFVFILMCENDDINLNVYLCIYLFVFISFFLTFELRWNCSTLWCSCSLHLIFVLCCLLACNGSTPFIYVSR